MITHEDAIHTYEYDRYIVIYLNYNWWKKELIPGRKPVETGFEYSSEKTKNGLP